MKQFNPGLQYKAAKIATSSKVGVDKVFMEDIRIKQCFLRFRVFIFNLKVDVETGVYDAV
jgi:hypothetical protein